MNVDVPKLLTDLGLGVRRSGEEFRGFCPEPSHASRSKQHGPGTWQIRTDDGRHHCFACGYGGGVLTLIQTVRGLTTRKEAYRWLRETQGFRIPDDPQLRKWRGKALTRITPTLKVPPFSVPLWVPPFNPVQRAGRDYLFSRDFTEDEIELYEAHALPSTKGVKYGGRVILPVVVDGKMVDFVARLYVPASDLVPKALSGRASEGASKAHALWGYDFLDHSYPRVHVFEGIWGGVAALHVGVQNVVAACGSNWSAERTELLTPWPEIILVPDPDEAGHKFEITVASSVRFSHRLWVVDLPGKQLDDIPDPDERRRVLSCLRPPSVGYSLPSLGTWSGKA